MPKKPQPPQTPVQDARERVENILFMPFPYERDMAIEVLEILWSSTSEEEYFHRIKEVKV
jgi:hypothetical protein